MGRVGWGPAWASRIADLFCHGTQIMDNSRISFVTVCCSMSMVSKTSCSHFCGQGSYSTSTTHTLGLNFTIKLWAEFLAPLWVSLCMTLTWSERNYFAWFDGTVCEQPALVCHGSPQSRFYRRGVSSLNMKFVLARVQIWNPFAQFKFWVYGHTHASSNAVTLGGARLGSPQQ